MKSFSEWYQTHKPICESTDNGEAVVPASKAIDWKEYHEFNKETTKTINVTDNMSLQIKYFTEAPSVNKLCSAIFNTVYTEIFNKGGLSEENMSKIEGQNAWLNKDPIDVDLIIKNSALVFMRSCYVKQEYKSKYGDFEFRLYKESQDLGKLQDVFVLSSINYAVNTKVELSMEVTYGGGIDPKCNVKVTEICIYKAPNNPDESKSDK